MSNAPKAAQPTPVGQLGRSPFGTAYGWNCMASGGVNRSAGVPHRFEDIIRVARRHGERKTARLLPAV
jgi:hypothetical protein